MTIARNAPCPCGSGIKYKKCCLPKEVPAPGGGTLATGERPPGARIVEHRGQQFLASEGIDREALDVAAEHFEHRRRGRGPAQQLADFCQPLIDASGQDADGLQRAMELGMFFWNLALFKDESAKEEMLGEMLAKMRLSDADKEEFRRVAQQMIDRHILMFPYLHR